MKKVVISAAFIVFCVPSNATIIYVNAAATGSNNGNNWTNAFVDLQAALSSASPGDEIWVAAATYHASQGGDRSESMTLKDGVRIYGGFKGIEEDRVERNWRMHATVLSGNIGDSWARSDNTFRILVARNVSSEAVIDGFVIELAYNDREYPDGVGGGMYVEDATPLIRNCVFRDNVAVGGGATWNQNAAPTYENCTFKRSSDIACYNDGSDARYIDCTFRRNRGGAGAALYARNGSDLIVVRCAIIGNTADGHGGAYYGYGNPIFLDSLFAKNRAARAEGSYGGAMLLRAGSATITNCTIVKNWSEFNAGGISTFSETSTPTIRNCILWGNRSRNGEAHGWVEKDQAVLHAGSMKQSLIEAYTGLYGGRSNFDGDPLFVDVEDHNYRVRAGSPCIDRGKDDVVAESTDLDGNRRILSGRVDLGAYESVCEAVRDFDVEARENDSGGFDVVASIKTHLPAGSTVRLVFTPVDENGDPDPCCATGECGPQVRCPTVRRARIMADGRGKASLPDCPVGRVTVCVEGCGESLCREILCP